MIIFWFRRDLRLHDNHGLWAALSKGMPVLPLFIFDTNILDKLTENADARVQFIHQQLQKLNEQLLAHGSSVLIQHGKPTEVFRQLVETYKPAAVFTNRDYEPYARERDQAVEQLLRQHNIAFETFKDHVIFEPHEVLKPDGNPYAVFTPYSKRWNEQLLLNPLSSFPSEALLHRFHKGANHFPSIGEIGFQKSKISVPDIRLESERISTYEAHRDFPAREATSMAGTHLRFGTVSIRALVAMAQATGQTYLNELIWREFFMQVLFHHPHTTDHSFYAKYDRVPWRHDEAGFKAWTEGKTGYPMVDAGMRELIATGLMHNRVRMVVASFLTKHLLIDWRWGEAWFAAKLLDYEQSSNVGNWQWAAGTGCDAAPYFRVFNPTEQQKKFDPQGLYIRKWIPELDSFSYPRPIVDHAFARQRAIETYKKAIEGF